MREKAIDLLKGAYDLHVHSNPSHVKRNVDDIELIEEANEYQMGGVMIKNHYESTVGRAEIINQHFKFKTKAYGGVVLNYPVGGLNPYACESALKLGGSFVWLPTRDSKQSLIYGNMPGDFFDRQGITILDDKGKLKKEVFEIMEIVKKYNAVLATGHLSVEETMILCDESISRGIKTVLTHPDWNRTKVDLDLQVELGVKGVVIEKVWANLDDGDCTKEEFLNVMKRLDYKNVYVTTDRGINKNKKPLDSMIDAVEFLIDNSVDDKSIRQMIVDTPKYLVEE